MFIFSLRYHVSFEHALTIISSTSPFRHSRLTLTLHPIETTSCSNFAIVIVSLKKISDTFIEDTYSV